MNCQIRVRKYGSGWLAWSVYYQGERLYLNADKPDREILPDKMNETLRIFQSRDADIQKFMRDVFQSVLEGGKRVISPFQFQRGIITFVQRRQEINVDCVMVQTMGAGGWSKAAEYRLANNGHFVFVGDHKPTISKEDATQT